MDTTVDDEETPEHLQPDGLPELPVAVWAKMTKQQREDYLNQVRLYKDQLAEERRQERKRSYGY